MNFFHWLLVQKIQNYYNIVELCNVQSNSTSVIYIVSNEKKCRRNGKKKKKTNSKAGEM